MPAFPSWVFTRCHHHSNWGSGHPIAAHYSFIDPGRMKGWVGLVGWPIADGLPHKWSPISYRSSAGQRKHASKRPMFYRLTTQPTVLLGISGTGFSMGWMQQTVSQHRRTEKRWSQTMKNHPLASSFHDRPLDPRRKRHRSIYAASPTPLPSLQVKNISTKTYTDFWSRILYSPGKKASFPQQP